MENCIFCKIVRGEAPAAIASQLARLNVDVIEAGFPASSDEDFAAVRDVA